MNYDRREWRPARSARQLECVSPNMLGIHALHASLSLLLEVGMDILSRLILDNAANLLESLGKMQQLELVTPAATGRHAGIVTFRHRKAEPTRL
jgi:cysteine desulfurase/selenocysteine lyase